MGTPKKVTTKGTLQDLTWKNSRAELDEKLGLTGLQLFDAGSRGNGGFGSHTLDLVSNLIERYTTQNLFEQIEIAGLSLSYTLVDLYFMLPASSPSPNLHNWFNAEGAMHITNGVETVAFASTITFDDYQFEVGRVFESYPLSYYVWLLHVSARLHVGLYATSKASLDTFITILAVGL